MSLFSVDRKNGTAPSDGGSAPPDQINIIGNGTRIEGTIDTEHNLRIGGELDGDVESTGKLMIAESGRVDGEVHAASADVAGELDGEIRVDGLLVLRSSAVIRGDVRTEKLVIEDGAVFTGHCTMTSGGAEHGSGRGERSQGTEPVEAGSGQDQEARGEPARSARDR